MAPDDAEALAAVALKKKRVAMLLRDARSVLRSLDVLLATALAAGDESVPSVAAARKAVERLVRELSLRQLIVGRSGRRPRGGEDR